jgi:uncharacterized Rossmann fold enzyme
MLESGIRPDIIVTDLDGNVETLMELNEQGIVLVIHAHGDNIEHIQNTVPKFSGPLFGTQCEEVGNVRNLGGFTDGDRAVFLAMELVASTVVLRGFDFDSPVAKSGADTEIKMKKLAYAKELIEFASNHDGVLVVYR